jgi:hypothetical protein
MTINIEALIYCLGKSYKDITEAGIISYKAEPKGSSGSPALSLDMVKEGVFLSFKREGRRLKEIALIIQRDDVKDWSFPNELPTPLQQKMSREWIHKTFGEPEGSIVPKVIMKQSFGWVEKFTVEDFHIPITMQIRYDLQEIVKKITFLPTSELRW